MNAAYSRSMLAGGTMLLVSLALCSKGRPEPLPAGGKTNLVKLPDPRNDGDFPLERALWQRRSVREFGKRPLSLSEASQLLWAAQGTTDPAGFRTAPSAGAFYPLEVYIVAGRVTGLAAGVYRYGTRKHELTRIGNGDRRKDLHDVALQQDPILDAPLIVVITAVYERTRAKYGERGDRYTDIEVGHAAQNVCLQAVSLGLGAVTIGAFDDEGVRKVLGAGVAERPLYIIPVGAL